MLRDRSPCAVKRVQRNGATATVPRAERLDGDLEQGGALLLRQVDAAPKLANLTHAIAAHNAFVARRGQAILGMCGR
jgi:hypothetical protein